MEPEIKRLDTSQAAQSSLVSLQEAFQTEGAEIAPDEALAGW